MAHIGFLNSALWLLLLMMFTGCNSSISGSVQETSETAAVPTSPQTGGFYSPSKPQKVTTRTLSGNISKYTVYLSVGSSQVAAP